MSIGFPHSQLKITSCVLCTSAETLSVHQLLLVLSSILLKACVQNIHVPAVSLARTGVLYCEGFCLVQYRCIRMALVHDLAESIVGDWTPYDGVSKVEKYRRELVRN